MIKLLLLMFILILASCETKKEQNTAVKKVDSETISNQNVSEESNQFEFKTFVEMYTHNVDFKEKQDSIVLKGSSMYIDEQGNFNEETWDAFTDLTKDIIPVYYSLDTLGSNGAIYEDKFVIDSTYIIVSKGIKNSGTCYKYSFVFLQDYFYLYNVSFLAI